MTLVGSCLWRRPGGATPVQDSAHARECPSRCSTLTQHPPQVIPPTSKLCVCIYFSSRRVIGSRGREGRPRARLERSSKVRRVLAPRPRFEPARAPRCGACATCPRHGRRGPRRRSRWRMVPATVEARAPPAPAAASPVSDHSSAALSELRSSVISGPRRRSEGARRATHARRVRDA